MEKKENFDNFMDAWNSLTEGSEEELSNDKNLQEQSQETFDTMVDEVSEIIPEGDQKEIESKESKVDMVEQVLSEVCQTKDVDDVKEKILNSEDDKNLEVIDLRHFDKLPDSDVKKKEEAKEEESIIVNEIPEKKSKGNLIKKMTFKDGKIEFFLDSPSRLFDQFYAFKRELVEELTPGEQLAFDDLTSQLLKCNINIRTNVFNNEEYIRQMTVIQGFMDSVKNIQVTCNNQYFVWEEFLPNIKGCLARVEYLKPAIKQEGFVHEHMRDLVWYYSKLKHLHESCKGVVKTLEKSFEAVSRKASITTPNRPMERYQRFNKVEEKKYDALPVENESKKEEKNSSGFCSWGEIK